MGLINGFKKNSETGVVNTTKYFGASGGKLSHQFWEYNNMAFLRENPTSKGSNSCVFVRGGRV